MVCLQAGSTGFQAGPGKGRPRFNIGLPAHVLISFIQVGVLPYALRAHNRWGTLLWFLFYSSLSKLKDLKITTTTKKTEVK